MASSGGAGFAYSTLCHLVMTRLMKKSHQITIFMQFYRYNYDYKSSRISGLLRLSALLAQEEKVIDRQKELPYIHA
jgi:hypothetical protein